MTEILVEESVAGWKEFELEVMRDGADNAVIVCSIENVDPMGVHTGDSMTVAPAMTLTDREYQAMRDAAIACIRAIGVETGGSNVQFAVNPDDGRMVLIEMNPRVSRVQRAGVEGHRVPDRQDRGACSPSDYTLDEIPNDITGETLAAFEPALDYVAVKIPRWAFEKFPGADPRAFDHDEVASARSWPSDGRSPRRWGKAYRALSADLDLGGGRLRPAPSAELAGGADRGPAPSRGGRAWPAGTRSSDVAAASRIDPWFVEQIARVAERAASLRAARST